MSDPLSESTKKVLSAEEGLANAKTEIKKRDDIIIEKQKAIERADRENKRVHKTLEEISRNTAYTKLKRRATLFFQPKDRFKRFYISQQRRKHGQILISSKPS